MPTIIQTPIIKAWAEDTSNKDAPSQTAIGEGIVYASPLTSSEPNGALYNIFEAAKFLQRTGGLYNPSIPYIQGQSCSVVRNMENTYGIFRYVCTSSSDISNYPPIIGATITTVNGVDIYSGGVVENVYWVDADNMEGYAPAGIVIPYDSIASNVPPFKAVSVGERQYVNIRGATAMTDVNPETNRNWFMKAPTLDEILSIMDGIYYPKWATQAESTTTYPLRRLGVYKFRGRIVEAFCLSLNGLAFTDNGTSNQSKFWRSFSSIYPSQCVINNTIMRDFVFSGSAGGSITPRNYLGRVEVVPGTATLSSGSSEARATVGNVQDDQVQAHWHSNRDPNVFSGQKTWATGTSRIMLNDATTTNTAPGVAGQASSDGVHDTPRIGYNTREATFSVTVPTIVSLLPYGQITL